MIKMKKLHPEAKLPTRARPGDAGMDIYAVSREFLGDYLIEYDTGIAVEIPEGHVGLLFPRSSASGTDLFLRNAVGVIDSGYRGSLKFRYTIYNPTNRKTVGYNVGERVGQLLIVPINTSEPMFVDELSETARGTGGFGSSGLC
jgi:dUTP pyrophosphatase